MYYFLKTETLPLKKKQTKTKIANLSESGCWESTAHNVSILVQYMEIPSLLWAYPKFMAEN